MLSWMRINEALFTVLFVWPGAGSLLWLRGFVMVQPPVLMLCVCASALLVLN